MHCSTRLVAGSIMALALLLGCSKDQPGTSGAPSASSSSPSAPSTASAPVAPASATASAAPAEPHHDCPKDSAGVGSFDKPCEAHHAARMMEAVWTGKTDDKGPHFRITNKSSLVILYGKIAVYFYDKSGKQLDTQDKAATPPKTISYKTCSGNIFGGVMKPGEKAVLTFSCLKKDVIPEGTTAIEAELEGVGFADASDEKKVDFYWKNTDLVPDARKKGGVKK